MQFKMLVLFSINKSTYLIRSNVEVMGRQLAHHAMF